ncbi:MAG: CDP-glucose 4,6-dehydratase [bacterium]|nr:CDP-glucose 4,6-dehydratase [bacterium]
MLNNTYRNKRVLVTGHTGFKGSWLSLWLEKLGAEVHGIALEPKTVKDNFEVTGLGKRINHNICNIKDRKKLVKLINEIKPEMMFHLAAQPLVKESFDDPAETYETNLMGTVNILEAIRLTPSVKVAVMITSDKCYRNVEWEWGYRETDTLGGLDPYGASKACAELAIDSYRDSFFKRGSAAIVASVRAGNVIGGGDWSENRIVPDIIRGLIEERPVELRNPNATRPWQFVLEPLSGYLWLGAQMLEADHGSGWNFGPELSTIVPVGILTGKMIAAWGSGSIKDISDKKHFHEATLLSLDISKARHRLQWKPTLNLNETIKFTMGWYKQFTLGADLYPYGMEQLDEYTKIARKRGLRWAKK